MMLYGSIGGINEIFRYLAIANETIKTTDIKCRS